MAARPDWFAPEAKQGCYRTGLKLINSLTLEKDEFITQTGDQNLYWYMCGPTVYDAAHLGHARTYVGSDILRRVLRDYFHYNVYLSMNITDIDDKIIMRSIERKQPFSEFARFWEKDFLDDMAALNVEPPDVMTRVSEYVPDIVAYIEKMISNGYAYESNGSVYFDTATFKEGGHCYGKLEPNSVNDQERLDEAEGALSVGAADKKSPGDFALWKKSKEGEPYWESPWGDGRPGWHIECSVMAGDTLPCPMDIHSGGIDLRFPHHDNEIAQSEAYYDCKQWVNYFLHTGHLHIKGKKMSKSLKNFSTIKDALKEYSAKQLRVLFLLHRWYALMDYDQETCFEQPRAIEKQFQEIFLNIQVALRGLSIDENQRLNDADKELMALLKATQENVHTALLDSIDTEAAITHIQALITRTNVYLSAGVPKALILNRIRTYLKFILNCFGLEYDKPVSEITEPLIDIITKFRSDLKSIAKTNDTKAILAQCDLLRDEQLPDLGIRVEDLPDQSSIWKFVDPESLKLEREQKRQEKEKKEAAAAKKKAEREAKQAEEEAKAKIPPEQYFRQFEDKYSVFDEEGLPTKTADGTEISKAQRKKLVKELQKHERLFKKYSTPAPEKPSS